ncbi:M64 family metallopeptidase [Agromyces endophyticus]|uniref:M64 family metallopeptidase n=1 Tax=Agromyces sp. H17E-10 TaxID=2932244 RepID=UPI001FD0CD18|nr:M64 family metallopeptidase [Agromyces sp. H17E-10]UOQ87721.1 M64 family metallopeptidase [Agromyces sp. H17E-10]
MRSRSSVAAIITVIATLITGAVVASPANAEEVTPLPDPKVVPVQVTGPAADRLNLIVLGDGYQADQQSIFRSDLDRNLSVLWSTEPFRTYRDYINVYSVEVPSIDYGVRCDPDGRVRHPDGTIRDTGEREGPINEKNTALRMNYGGGCSDPLARGVTPAGAPVGCEDDAGYYPPGVNPCETGSQALNRILETYVSPVLGIPRNSQNLQTLVIFNTFTYGGIGGTNATTSGGSPQGPLISMHELGHSLGTLADEYPYSSRDVVRNCYTGAEPSSFHHTTYTSAEQMIADQKKWFRWLGEESISGGTIGLYESGNTYPCGIRRPSEHSMMRWLGFDFDQIGRENMVARITGMRNAAAMNVDATPDATVPGDGVLWAEAGHPRFHELQYTWRVGGPTGEVLETNGNPYLDLEPLDLPEGTVVSLEVRDPVGPDGIDWVRNPSTNSTSSDSGFNGPRFVQARQWTVGAGNVTPSEPAAEITNATLDVQPVAADEIVFVETNHPADRVLDVAWTVDGETVANPGNRRTLDLGELDLPAGTHELTVTVTDPADASESDSKTWTIDGVLPTAPRTLSEPLVELDGDLEHPVYFDGWDMALEPQDDTTGYDGDRAVVGQFRLDDDGWFNYFGFPEQQDTPFHFSHSGSVVKALTYGNLGSGGLSKAAFEQTLPDDHPLGGFVPGFGTHVVDHRAIDPAGNVGEFESYRATVLPGALAECDTTLTGSQAKVVVKTGVTCITDATVRGGITVAAGASIVVTDSTVNGGLRATDAATVQMFGSTVRGASTVSGTTTDITIAGTAFTGDVVFTGNTQVSANDRFSRLAGEYGPVFVGNTVTGDLACSANSAALSDFGAANTVGGAKSGDCSAL